MGGKLVRDVCVWGMVFGMVWFGNEVSSHGTYSPSLSTCA